MNNKKLSKRLIDNPYFNSAMIVFGFFLFVISQHVPESWFQSLERGYDFWSNLLPVSKLSWFLLLASTLAPIFVAFNYALQKKWFRHFMGILGVITVILLWLVILFGYLLAGALFY